jgi:ATP-dependent RNA helicase SUPV3L1/SUV3
VRVDMLERLADMIRDRLFWKPRIPEEVRPVGSFEGGGFSVIPDMMSVVGCSGEDFQDILTSLGYRSQIRQVAKPVQLAQPKPEAVESNPQPVEPLTDVVAADDSIAEVVALAVEETAAPEVPAPEMFDVTVWWPKDMGPFKIRPPRPDKPKFEKPKFAKPDFAKQDNDNAKRDGKPFKKRFEKPERQAPPERPKRPEKPMDPNSPFAALAALKASMGKGNG